MYDASLNAPARAALEAPLVTITRPPVVALKSSLSSGILCPPIGPAYLAACLRQAGFRAALVDPVGESPFEMHSVPGRPLVTYGWPLPRIVSAIPQGSRFVGLSCMFSHEWPVARQLAEQIRSRFPDAILVAGGEHMTAAPEHSLADCPALDYVVLGEGEETLVDLVRTLTRGGDPLKVAGLCFRRDGSTVRTGPRQRLQAVDDVPWPAWDLVPVESYLSNGLSYGVGQGRTMPILATRGCPFKCTFCSSPGMWTQRWYPRNPKAVADEIEAYAERYRATNFDFYDLTAIIRKGWIVEFCHELIHRKLNISWQLPAWTRSEAIDEEVADLLARSGHRNIVYAPESGSERMLDLIKKRVDLGHMLKSMRACIRHGISVKLNMIMGFPEETRTDIVETYRFLARTAWSGVDDATISTFIPYPGSELFQGLRKKGLIAKLDDDYYFGLATQGDFGGAVSYAQYVPARALAIYKVLGIMLFYGLSYLSRPKRLFDTVRHLLRHDHKTRIEKALSAIMERVWLSRRAKVAATQ